jgi:hypothetical protein
MLTQARVRHAVQRLPLQSLWYEEGSQEKLFLQDRDSALNSDKVEAVVGDERTFARGRWMHMDVVRGKIRNEESRRHRLAHSLTDTPQARSSPHPHESGCGCG